MIALIILDGWGLAAAGPSNAVAMAHTPVMDRIQGCCPSTRLSASGGDVGLPDGQMGNSEVGHLNLGAGRVVVQSLTRIDAAIADGSFFAHPALDQACAAGRGGRLHLVGLCSDGGIHGVVDHAVALLELARRKDVADVCVHAVTDGRDTAPGSAGEFLAVLRRAMDRAGRGRIASLSGRYYAMDREGHWDRTRLAFAAMAGQGPRQPDVAAALAASAGRLAPNGRDPETDEFLLPTVIGDGAIRAGDAVIAWNWRADRMRQLSRALTDPAFDRFARPFDRVAHFVGMGPYDEAWPLPAAFPGMDIPQPVGEVFSRAGLRQLRLAETAKYAHVTYFFNGGVESPLDGEQRLLIPSPAVATYDLQPEMSAAEVGAQGAAAIRSGRFDLLVVNLANPDMVGHTGVLAAATRACEAADQALGQLLDALFERGGQALVVADHGNAEVMVDPDTGLPHTAHTTHPVPCVLVGAAAGTRLRDGGRLADVGPTLIELAGLKRPAVMTGSSLILRGEPTDA